MFVTQIFSHLTYSSKRMRIRFISQFSRSALVLMWHVFIPSGNSNKGYYCIFMQLWSWSRVAVLAEDCACAKPV